MFFNFQILDYRIFKNIKANPCGFILDNVQQRTTNQMCEVSLKYMETNGRGSDLNIPSVLIFFRMLLFEIKSAFLARRRG